LVAVSFEATCYCYIVIFIQLAKKKLQDYHRSPSSECNPCLDIIWHQRKHYECSGRNRKCIFIAIFFL